MIIIGYVHGIRWTDEKIKEEIHSVMRTLDIQRMPSSVEIERVMNNSKLTNAIAKRGGYNYWAKKLNLEQSKCETRLGELGENYIKQLLEHSGYKVEKMTTIHPYDLLINNDVKIDVKTSKIYSPKYSNWSSYSFNLEKKNPTCDLYALVCLDEENKVVKTLIIPSKFVHQTQICISANKTKYDIYKDRWDYIKQYDNFYKEVV